MLFGILLHTLSFLGIYSGGVSATPASLEAPLLDNGAVHPRVPHPHLILQAFANVYADLAESRPISIPEGTRVNVNILGWVMITILSAVDTLTNNWGTEETGPTRTDRCSHLLFPE